MDIMAPSVEVTPTTCTHHKTPKYIEENNYISTHKIVIFEYILQLNL